MKITPENAWEPLSASAWDRDAARHLAARLGFSLHRSLVDRIERLGPGKTLVEWLGPLRPFEAPEAVLEMEASMAPFRESMAEADAKEKRELQRARQRLARSSFQDYALEWYRFAREPANSAQEKLVLFFQNVWVVSFLGVKDPGLLFDHQDRIRRLLRGSYPDMCRALSVSPAMVRYLDLHQNRKGAPNENFARELLELFTLGEGHYTEEDIKAAARALTGYTIDRQQKVRFVPRRHDNGRKTLFGKTGDYDLAGVLEQVFAQPAAARFLPSELARFYLAEDGLDEAFIEPLAEAWQASGFSLPFLYDRFFRSRIFYEAAFRGNLIKSPNHYYLGMLQDLELEVFPSPRRASQFTRLMGQPFYSPPNVRGWVGGRRWINSATLAARRRLAETVVTPIPRRGLNADELRALEAAEADGRTRFVVPPEELRKLLARDPETVVHELAERLYVNRETELLRQVIASLEASSHRGQGAERAALLVAALVAPAYHLC